MIATIAIFLEYTTPYNITTAGKGMRFLVGGTIGGVYKSNRIDY